MQSFLPMQNFSEFERRIGITFSDTSLLKKALTHSSYVNEHPRQHLEHNERLEFLGDAVLELVVTAYLFSEYPQKPEGELTSFRAALVNANTLGHLADGLHMDKYLLLSHGAKKDPARARLFILANAFEALVGAIYLDRGYESAANFIKTHLLPYMEEVLAHRLWQDAKSLFQERAQEHVNITPTYEVIHEEGPDHEKHFVVGVFLEDERIAQGEGPSKQEAQQQAAAHALEIKGWTHI